MMTTNRLTLAALLLIGCPEVPPADLDADGDGFAADVDCNEDSAAFHPGAADPWGDDLDQNCDGVDGVDADGDGYVAEGPPDWWHRDCDDTDPRIHPGVWDRHDDEIDTDCDGTPMMGVVGATTSVGVGDSGGVLSSAQAVGDVDGDGFDDLAAVWTHDAGREVLLFDGYRLTGAIGPEDAFASIAWLGGLATGRWVHPVGDIDADGLDDLAILTSWDHPVPRQSAVFLGRTLAAGGARLETDSDLVLDHGGHPSGVHGIGDVDGDGHEDLAAVGWHSPSDDASLWVHLGGPDLSTDLGPEDAHIRILLDSRDCAVSVDAAGDLDGDGRSDVAVGTGYFCGADHIAVVLPGSHLAAGGVARLDEAPTRFRSDAFEAGDDDSTPSGVLMIPPWVLTPGDVDGDGTPDLVVILAKDEGPAVHSESRGQVLLYSGDSVAQQGSFEPDDAVRELRGGWEDAEAGLFATAGDLDGDGQGDLVLTFQRFWAPSAIDRRSSVVYAADWSEASAEIPEEGRSALHAGLGESPAGIVGLDATGDFDGDGFDDLLVQLSDVGHLGRAFVFFGEP